MTRRRWIADEVHGNTAALTGEHASHLSRVLRAQIGQEFDVATGDAVRLGRITSLSDNRVEFWLGDVLPARSAANITLVLAIFKFDRMEWAIEKCTELGVTTIVPVIAKRTDSHLAQASANRLERWRRLALQASEQSRRLDTPEIKAPAKLKEVVTLKKMTRILLAESEDQTSIKDVLAHHPAVDDLALAIGPEGGWTDSEVGLFTETGWIAASLGTNILRTETATIAAVAIVTAFAR